MATTADFRNGLYFYHQDALHLLLSFQHVKPGKGGAFVRTKLKNVLSGKIFDHTFNAGVRIETARIERRPHQFLYKDEEFYHFMDTKNFEQVSLPKSKVPHNDLLKESQEVELLFHVEASEILSCVLPAMLNLRVTYTEPGLRGDTATHTLKPAQLETGATLQVPLFIEQNDLIKVDVENRKYVERVRN